MPGNLGGLAAAQMISGIAASTTVVMRALRKCNELTMVARATPCLAISRGMAAAQLISGIAASTMVMLRALR